MVSAFRANAKGSECFQSPFARSGVYCLVFMVLFAIAGKFLILYRASNILGWMTAGLSDMVFYGLGMVAMLGGLALLFFGIAKNPITTAVLSVLAFLSVYLIGYTFTLLPVAIVLAVVAWFASGMINPGLNRALIAAGTGCLALLLIFCLRAWTILPYAQADSSEVAAGTGLDSISVAEWTSSNANEKTDMLARFVSARCTRFGIKNPPRIAVVALPARFYPTKGYYDLGSNTIFVNVVSLNEPIAEPKEGIEPELAPEPALEGVLHSIAHMYESQRVNGEIPKSKNWPYTDGMPSKDKSADVDPEDTTWPEEAEEYGFSESRLQSAEDTPSLEEQAVSFEGYAKSYISA